MTPGGEGWRSRGAGTSKTAPTPERLRGVASGEQCVGVASGAGWGRGPWEEAAKRGRAESPLLFLWRPRRAEPGELAAGSALEPAVQGSLDTRALELRWK